MAFERWNRRFEGPFFVPDFLKHEAGVYVIWCNKGDSWTILDVGEALDVKKKVSDQENLTCWQKHCNGKIYYSATYTEGGQLEERLKIERMIKSRTRPATPPRQNLTKVFIARIRSPWAFDREKNCASGGLALQRSAE